MRGKILEISYLIINFFLKIKNIRKPKVLIYTDSRGYDVVGGLGKNPFRSYIKKILYSYNTRYFICKEKHTTILDFLQKIKKIKIEKYDFIILHCGVVDFSPRPVSNYEWVLKTKEGNDYFDVAKREYRDYYLNPSKLMYNGEKTQNLYSPNFLKDKVIPELKKVNNLIWINSNNFVEGWEGNYTKGRPINIDEKVSFFDKLMEKELKNIVDLRSWNNEEIKKYTIDNIHFSKVGFEQVYKKIQKKIIEINK